MVSSLYTSASLEETQHIAEQLANSIPAGSIIAFFGDLGAGKTTFIRLFAEQFGVMPDEVNSPTFQYLNIYKGSIPIYHFDLYRLRGVDDFLGMGFEETFESGGICCIEWAERIDAILPKENLHVVRIRHDEQMTRHIEIEGPACRR
jgi:tRNA threonylcarbamoyladenosine biosynthesis protein TsaE